MRPSIAITRLTGALLVLLCASCSSFRHFQHAVVERGGHDGEGGADQVYFELRNVEGHSGDGLWALMLPPDWPDRRAVTIPGESEGETLAIDPPVAIRWTKGAEIVPKVTLAKQQGDWGGELHLSGGEHNPLKIKVFDNPSQLRRGTGNAAQRLLRGESAYALVDDSPEDELADGRLDYRLFGARLTPMGKVEWVQLLRLSFEDSRGGVAQALDVPFRQIQVFEAAFYFAALGWPLFLL